jgi:hypothetical protein
LHAPERLRAVALDMLADQPSSCRQLAAVLGLDKSTVWAWRQKINRLLLGPDERGPSDAAMARGVIFRESRKASREWVNHRRDPAFFPRPDRHRWIDYKRRKLALPRPMTPYLVSVFIDVATEGACHVGVRPVQIARPDHGARSRDCEAQRQRL